MSHYRLTSNKNIFLTWRIIPKKKKLYKNSQQKNLSLYSTLNNDLILKILLKNESVADVVEARNVLAVFFSYMPFAGPIEKLS